MAHRAEFKTLTQELLTLSRKDKEDLILAALVYRSGPDSCNSVYMGSMATAAVIHALGGEYGKHDAKDLLTNAPDSHVDETLEICIPTIVHMRKYPTKRCPCCGQIVPATEGKN